MAHFLGHLQWVVRPVGGGGGLPFLAGACTTFQCRHNLQHLITPAHTTSTVLLMTFCTLTIFSDATRYKSGFRVAVVGHPGWQRVYMCPRWVHGLQQAELCAFFMALKFAASSRLSLVAVGIDNDVARVQAVSFRVGTAGLVQLCILCLIY